MTPKEKQLSQEKENLKIKQGEETKLEILKIAKKQFGKKGYNSTSIEDILAEMGVTKGALYHHFSSKRDIFWEVCKMMNQNSALELQDVSWKDFLKSIPSIWDLAEDPEFVQIWIRDCYSVLSPEEIFQLDEDFIITPLKNFLERMAKENKIKALPSFEEAHILIGLINQGLWLVSNTKKKDRAIIKKNLTKIFTEWIRFRESK
ncbi:TetR/AcrR family transcriptional regulator [Leptospira sp. WS60.C2]